MEGVCTPGLLCRRFISVEMGKLRKYCSLFLIFFILTYTNGQPYYRPGRRVCSGTRRTTEIVPVNQTYIRPFYNRDCDNEGTCNGTRILYKATYRTVFYRRIVHDVVRRCCPGWQKKNHQDIQCSIPICKTQCQNGGRCIGPDQCLCPKNFTGMKCEKDVDECSTGIHDCQQICHNTHGSFKCSCFDGFVLAGASKCQFCPVCLPAFEDMMNQVNLLQNRVIDVEKEKEQLIQNLSMIENHYTDAMHQVAELKEVTIRTLTSVRPIISTTKTRPIETSTQSSAPKFDMMASLSEQIALLEERIGTCNCGYGPRRYNTRRRSRGRI